MAWGQLRSVVHDCLAKHMYEAAAFFADKLVTLSGYAPAEVYTLAQAFFCSRQYRRCLQLLRSTELIEKDLRFRYLAARCGLCRLRRQRWSVEARVGWEKFRLCIVLVFARLLYCPACCLPLLQMPGRVQGVGGVSDSAGGPGC